MHDRYRHLLLVIVAFLCAVAGVAKHAVALTFTEFPVPGASPGSIAAGPDGALWFTEPSIHVNKIGRITAEGGATDLPIPTANSPPVIITAGDARAPRVDEKKNRTTRCVIEAGVNAKIGRITTAGAITEFPIPTANSEAYLGITTGPDGALWFNEIFANQIGRITTDGVITEFKIPFASASAEGGIAQGPDGALWFTEASASQIGRLALTIVNSHDFNADGKSDIAWRDTSGNVAIWEMNGTTVLNPNTAGVGNVATNFKIAGSAEFNGDGKSDVLWRDTTSGNVAIWFMNGTSVTNPNAAGVGNLPIIWTIQDPLGG